MLQILEKLVSFKSLPHDFKERRRAIFWIKNFLKRFPLNLKYFEFSGHPSLIALTQKRNPKIFLAAHVDVVPGPEGLFKLKIKKRKAFGRGVFDMKFAIACYLRLVQELKYSLKNLDLGIMITSDEETGGFFGTRKLLERGFKSKIVFLPDGGCDLKIERMAKGVWHLKVEIKGKPAHGSRPWEGKGANERLIEFLRDFSKFFPKEPCKTKHHWHRTLTIGKIEGGELTNQVSGFSRAFLDIRFLNEKEKVKIENYLGSLQKRFKVKITELATGSPIRLDLKNNYVKLFMKVLKENTKKEPQSTFSHGSSDARFFGEVGIPVIVTRPKGGGAHSEEEWIDIESLERFYSILKDFVLKLN